MPAPTRPYRYLDTLTVAFVTILLISNLVAQKVCRLGPVPVSGAMLLFPITYIFGDIFTEVYGYAASRRAIWLALFGTLLLYVTAAITIALPADPAWHNQQAFQTVFGFVPRILAGSILALWAGEFANSYTMAKLKLLTGGRWLWTRTVGSTVVGQAVDTTIVITFAFWRTLPWFTIAKIIATAYTVKVLYEFLATPLTYAAVNFLKSAEHADAFDKDTDFSPFHF